MSEIPSCMRELVSWIYEFSAYGSTLNDCSECKRIKDKIDHFFDREETMIQLGQQEDVTLDYVKE